MRDLDIHIQIHFFTNVVRPLDICWSILTNHITNKPSFGTMLDVNQMYYLRSIQPKSLSCRVGDVGLYIHIHIYKIN